MKKIIIAVLIIAVLGVGYWLVSPLFIDKIVSEKLEDIMPEQMIPEAEAVVSNGSFSGLQGHNAQGTAKLLKINGKYFVRFEDDFRMTNGPDLFVYFGKDGKYAREAELGRLKGNIGGQNYEVPANLNPSDYNEVWVWCRAFSVAFGKAQLAAADAGQ